MPGEPTPGDEGSPAEEAGGSLKQQEDSPSRSPGLSDSGSEVLRL